MSLLKVNYLLNCHLIVNAGAFQIKKDEAPPFSPLSPYPPLQIQFSNPASLKYQVSKSSSPTYPYLPSTRRFFISLDAFVPFSFALCLCHYFYFFPILTRINSRVVINLGNALRSCFHRRYLKNETSRAKGSSCPGWHFDEGE